MNTVKGFRDIESDKRTAIRNIIEKTFKSYNFQAVETPIIEYEEFVKAGNEGDEAVSDIFKLQDKGKRKLALRYEFTFQLKRLAKNKKLPYRRYQIGEVFRDEPVKSGRFRQFTQCDVDIIGSTIKDEAEILKITSEIFEKYGFEPAETPIIEYEEFVKGSETQVTDQAVSDIFKLKDKGKRKLALRYELTFPLKRLIKNKKLPYKRYQIGEVFRDEPASSSKNRFRQFTQSDVDIIGSTIKDDAEILALTNEILKKLGNKAIILINSRKLLNEILDDLKIKEKTKNRF